MEIKTISRSPQEEKAIGKPRYGFLGERMEGDDLIQWVPDWDGPIYTELSILATANEMDAAGFHRFVHGFTGTVKGGIIPEEYAVPFQEDTRDAILALPMPDHVRELLLHPNPCGECGQ